MSATSTFGSTLKPVEIPEQVQGHTSNGTTPTFSPANKPTPLVGSWADYGWEKAGHGEPTSAKMPEKQATPLLPSSVGGFDSAAAQPAPAAADGTESYLSTLVQETAKLGKEEPLSDSPPGSDNQSGGEPADAAAATQRASPPAGTSSDFERTSVGTTYGRGPGRRHDVNSNAQRPVAAQLYQQQPQQTQQQPPYDPTLYTPGTFQPAPAPYPPTTIPAGYGPPQPGYGASYGGYSGYAVPYPAPVPYPYPPQQGPYAAPAAKLVPPPVPQQQPPDFGGAYNTTTVSAPPAPPGATKFTPPPPPTVSLANELAGPDSDTPTTRVGDMLFSLGRRWVHRLETWLAAHPKERPNAPCPSPEQYSTIETWLEKLASWYEANFNGRKAARNRGRGRGHGAAHTGGRGVGRPDRNAPHAPPAEDQATAWGTAW